MLKQYCVCQLLWLNHQTYRVWFRQVVTVRVGLVTAADYRKHGRVDGERDGDQIIQWRWFDRRSEVEMSDDDALCLSICRNKPRMCLNPSHFFGRSTFLHRLSWSTDISKHEHRLNIKTSQFSVFITSFLLRGWNSTPTKRVSVSCCDWTIKLTVFDSVKSSRWVLDNQSVDEPLESVTARKLIYFGHVMRNSSESFRETDKTMNNTGMWKKRQNKTTWIINILYEWTRLTTHWIRITRFVYACMLNAVDRRPRMEHCNREKLFSLTVIRLHLLFISFFVSIGHVKNLLEDVATSRCVELQWRQWCSENCHISSYENH